MNLTRFLSSTLPNAWIKEPHIKVYVRKSMRCNNDGVLIPFLDIGSVEVSHKFRNRGVFTAFLERFEGEAIRLRRGVFVESILEPRFRRFFFRRGYEPNGENNACKIW